MEVVSYTSYSEIIHQTTGNVSKWGALSPEQNPSTKILFTNSTSQQYIFSACNSLYVTMSLYHSVGNEYGLQCKYHLLGWAYNLHDHERQGKATDMEITDSSAKPNFPNQFIPSNWLGWDVLALRRVDESTMLWQIKKPSSELYSKNVLSICPPCPAAERKGWFPVILFFYFHGEEKTSMSLKNFLLDPCFQFYT